MTNLTLVPFRKFWLSQAIPIHNRFSRIKLLTCKFFVVIPPTTTHHNQQHNLNTAMGWLQTTPPQKLNGSLQEPQINIFWPQLYIMWSVTTSKTTKTTLTTRTRTTISSTTMRNSTAVYKNKNHNNNINNNKN